MKKNHTEILSLTVCGLSDAVRARDLSAADILDAYIASIEETDGAVNAYITQTFDTARRQAAHADERMRQGDFPALCGIPFAVKDNIAAAGIPMTCASEMLRDFVPAYSATAYERAVNAGGVLLGKTNLDEFAMGSSCEKSIFGPTHNPLDLSKSAGGSSGGSAAAVAVPSAAWALATDTGGSARQPAAFCGVCSMKPTYGVVSRYGVTEFASSLDTVCPITRDVRDNAYVLETLAGRDRRDMTTLALTEEERTYTEGLDGGVAGWKIALVNGYEAFVDADTVQCVGRTAALLQTLGADLVTVELPFLEEAVEIYLTVSAAEASSNLARYDGIRCGKKADGDSVGERMKKSRSAGFGDEVKRRILTGAYALSSTLTGDYYRRVKAAQQEICRRVYELFQSVDLLLLPTTCGAAFDLGSYEENPTALYGSDRFTALANLTGCPAISLPVTGEGSLPVGVTFMGSRRAEKKLYRAAFAVEDGLRGQEKGEEK
ncbi:MAG: amidase [Eubacteriales bacterium]